MFPKTARSQAVLIILILVIGIVGAYLLAKAGQVQWAFVILLGGYLVFTYMPLPKELKKYEQRKNGTH